MGYVKSFKSFNNEAGKAVKTRKIEEQDTGLTLGGSDPQFKTQQDDIKLLRSTINKMENDLVQRKNELNTKVIALENAVKIKEQEEEAKRNPQVVTASQPEEGEE
jgi:hypothetical protein